MVLSGDLLSLRPGHGADVTAEVLDGVNRVFAASQADGGQRDEKDGHCAVSKPRCQGATLTSFYLRFYCTFLSFKILNGLIILRDFLFEFSFISSNGKGFPYSILLLITIN